MGSESIPPDTFDLEAVRDQLRVAERKLALAEAQVAIARVGVSVSTSTTVGAVPGALSALGPALDVLFHTAKVSMLLTAMDSTILRANQPAAELFGLPLAELPGRRTVELTLPEDVEVTDRALASITDGSFIVKQYVRPDGTAVPALAMGWPLVDDDGAAVCILGVAVPLSNTSATRSALRFLSDAPEAGAD